MNFTSSRVEAEWNNPALNALLKTIVADASDYAMQRWQWDFTVTSIYRTPAEDRALKASGVHSAWRGLDVRTRDQSAEAVADVTAYVNQKWAYDPSRSKMQVCISKPHGTGPHAHFQVHPQTAERSAEQVPGA